MHIYYTDGAIHLKRYLTYAWTIGFQAAECLGSEPVVGR